MKSSTKIYAGTRVYKDLFGIESYVTKERGRVEFSVVNGLVRGDHKSPNPITFNKTVTECTDNLRVLTLVDGRTMRWEGPDIGLNCLGARSPIAASYVTGRTVLRERALAKVFDQLRGNSETLVDVAEGLATLRMLRSSVALVDGVGSLLSYLARDIKRRRHRGQVTLDYVTSKWLEYRYGWIPLVNSVYSAFENIARELESKEVEIVARSGARYNKTRTLWLQGNTSVAHPVIQKDWANDRIMLVYRFKLVDRSRLWDWTSLNPATIAWELVPFSFVADWFMSIGESLRALENWVLYRNQFLGGYEVYTAREIRSRKIGSVIGLRGGGYASEMCVGNWHMVRNFKNRVLVSSLPVPRGPRFRVKLNANKCLDAAALLHTVVGKRSREWGV